MESLEELHLEADQSLGRVSARAVLAAVRPTQPQPPGSRVLPRTYPNSSDSTITTPTMSSSSPNNFRMDTVSPTKDGGGGGESPRVLPRPPSRKKRMEASGKPADQTVSTLSSDDNDPLRGNETPYYSLPDDPPSFVSLHHSDNISNSTPFPSLSLKISIDEKPLPESNSSPPENNDHGHRKVERTGNRAVDCHDSDHVTDIVKPDIKLVSPSPTDDTPDPEEVNLKGKREDKIPLTKIGSSIRSSIRSKFGGSEKQADGGDGADREGAKRKLSGKPSSRLSVEHQLLGVSSSTLSNCTDQNETDCITVNEAVQKAGLGRYHVLPFVAAAMVIVLKCFLDGVPDNFTAMFQCV